MLEETLVFVDGENLSIRYKEMLKEGRKPLATNVVNGGSFIWSNNMFSKNSWNIKRVSYYTSVTGSDDAILDLRKNISTTTYTSNDGSMRRTSQLIPFVRKKSNKSRKESVCDIAIAVDVMRACYNDHAPTIYIMSGDGDFVPLYNEVVHAGKHIYAAAFSSGQHEEIPLVVDEFFCLDDYFFEREAPLLEQEGVQAVGG